MRERRTDGGQFVNQKVQRIRKEDVRAAMKRQCVQTYLWRYEDVWEKGQWGQWIFNQLVYQNPGESRCLRNKVYWC